MFSFGPAQIALLALVVLLLFGKRLPQVMFGLGSSITEFKKGVQGIEDEVKSTVDQGKSVARDIEDTIKKPAKKESTDS